MDLNSKYDACNPWPQDEQQKILFLLDTHNKFERELLSGWIQRHRNATSAEAPQVNLDLRDEQRALDSTPLLTVLALPADTLIIPLRVTWLPSAEAINSGPRVRDLILGDPRHPGIRRARRILKEAPERMHLLRGAPDTVANLRARFEQGHEAQNSDAAREFADFVARQAVVVLDLAERRLQGSRYKVPRQVAASLLASRAYNEALDRLAEQSGTPRAQLVKEAATYMQEMVSRPRTFWLDFYARFNNFCLGLA